MTDDQHEFIQEIERLDRLRADVLDDHVRRMQQAADQMSHAARSMGEAAGVMMAAGRR